MFDEKEIVSKEETFDKLEIRLGRIIHFLSAPSLCSSVPLCFKKR